MSMDVGGPSGSLKADINVTPLVDVMLVLLIIMMLVAPMLQQGVQLRLPDADNPTDKPETQEQTVLAIDANNQFWLNGVQVSRQEMAPRVKAILDERAEKVVVIRGDRDASYSAIMEAMDSLHEAEIEDIGLITESKKDANKPAGGN